MPAPDGTVVLSAGGQTDLELPVSGGYAPQVHHNQEASISGGGVFRSVTLAPERTDLNVPIDQIDRTKYIALDTFLRNINYSVGAITIQDPFETFERMHYVRGFQSGRWVRGDFYTCTLIFQQSAAEELTSNIIV